MNAIPINALQQRLWPDLLYLDQMKWIDLAKAQDDHEEGRKYRCVLEATEELVSAGRAVLPLSFAHCMEVAKIGDGIRRKKLARLMAELSRGWFLRSASCLLLEEPRKAIAFQFRKPFAAKEIAPITRSLKEAFVADGQLGAADFDDDIFNVPSVLEEFLATARVSRAFLARFQTFADNHESGRSLVWDTSREVRKRVYCARIALGIQDRLVSVLGEFGLTLKDLNELGPERCVELLESVPSLDVEINLHVERNEHRDRRIAANDEIDVGFLSMAVPYCRLVVTEKFWSSLVHRTKLDVKYGAQVGHDLTTMMLGLRTE